jgi:hypothetical protein
MAEKLNARDSARSGWSADETCSSHPLGRTSRVELRISLLNGGCRAARKRCKRLTHGGAVTDPVGRYKPPILEPGPSSSALERIRNVSFHSGDRT